MTHDHAWPKDGAQHKWGPWYPNTAREGVKPATQFRKCVDTRCKAYETREAPKA